MADYTIDVGFNTEELKSATEGGGAGATGGGGGGGFASAIKAGLMATGIIGLLLNLKVILDAIGFVLAFISSLLGLLVLKFLQTAVPFFSDFERNGVKFALMVINGVISGLEFLVNVLAGVLTLGQVGGFEENKIELPRFQEEIVLEAFDDLQKVKKQLDLGIASVDDLAKAEQSFVDGIMDSFLTESDFKAIQEMKDVNSQTYADTFEALSKGSEDLGSFFSSSQEVVVDATTKGFNALTNAMQHLEDKANEFMGGNSGGASGRRREASFAEKLKSSFSFDVKKNWERNLGFITGR